MTPRQIRAPKPPKRPLRTVELVYAATPPSMNEASSGFKSHWAVGMKIKHKWQEIFEILLLESKLPRGQKFIEAAAILHFPVQRRRDAENYLPCITKPLADALVNGGWIPDDTPEFYRFRAVGFASGPSRTVITVRALDEAP